MPVPPGASVDLCGLAAVVPGPLPEFHSRVREQREDNDEYPRNVQDDKDGNSKDRFRRSGCRGKDAGRAHWSGVYLSRYALTGLTSTSGASRAEESSGLESKSVGAPLDFGLQ
jgi:hypothetical protein